MTAACFAYGVPFAPTVTRTPAAGPSTRAASSADRPRKPIGRCDCSIARSRPRDVGVDLTELALLGIVGQRRDRPLPARHDQRVDRVRVKLGERDDRPVAMRAASARALRTPSVPSPVR